MSPVTSNFLDDVTLTKFHSLVVIVLMPTSRTRWDLFIERNSWKIFETCWDMTKIPQKSQIFVYRLPIWDQEWALQGRQLHGKCFKGWFMIIVVARYKNLMHSICRFLTNFSPTRGMFSTPPQIPLTWDRCLLAS